MFKNQIILDQKWAIDAVYTLFRRIPPDRKKEKLKYAVYQNWLEKKGRFSGADLAYIWEDDYTENEQQLFLGFMLSCKMCFEIEQDTNKYLPHYKERIFIAPQLLSLERPDNVAKQEELWHNKTCLLYTSPSPRDRTRSRMPSSP